MTQALRGDALPAGTAPHQGSLTVLGAVYKQITAPFGEFGHDALVASTRRAGQRERDR
jgi:hypothetical protein